MFVSSLIIAQFAAVDRLERAIEFMQSKIEELGGTLVVKMKVCIISDYHCLRILTYAIAESRVRR
jgi:hypothetical protein